MFLIIAPRTSFSFCDRGKLAEATPLYREALAIETKQRGNCHPDVARGCHNLALLLYKQDRSSAEARRLGLRALAICEAALGAGHPNTRMVRRMWIGHAAPGGGGKRGGALRVGGGGHLPAGGCAEGCCPRPASPPPAAFNLAEFTAMCEEEGR